MTGYPSLDLLVFALGAGFLFVGIKSLLWRTYRAHLRREVK